MMPRSALPHLPWLRRWMKCLPSQCAVCAGWPGQPVCGACLSRFASTVTRCPGCAVAWAAAAGAPPLCHDCLRTPLPLEGCLAALDYAYPWSELLTGLKFRQETGWTGFFVERLLAQGGLRDHLARLGSEDWVVPLPLSRERLAARGFNQAWELARRLHQQSHCLARLDARLLLRVRDTPPQSQLGRQARLRNLEGAFLVDPLRNLDVAGRQVLLVDDVMTTGASLSAAAQALKAAGAAAVTGVVVARTPA